MLESLRKGAASWVAKLFLGLLMVSFVFWGMADWLRNYGQEALATVGGRQIQGAEFQRSYRNQLEALGARVGRPITPAEAQAYGLPQQVLSSMIGGVILDLESAKLGLGLPDKVVAEKIMNDPQFHDADGKFNPKAFQAALRQIGLTEQGFAAQERRNALREQLIDAVEQSPDVPRTLLDALNRYQNEERVIQYFVIPEAAAGDVPEPGEEALKSYYDGHKGQFTAPEYRKIAVLLLTPETYKDAVKVPDEDVKAEYETHKDKYSEPEQREVQQIAFPSLAAAKAAKEKLDQGADFMTVAKEAGFKETDVNLGLVARSALIDPKVADAAFALEKDKISAPIEGTLSTALLRVTRIVPAADKSLDDVKDSIRSAIALQRAADEIGKLYDRIEDERAAGTSLTEISRKESIPLFESVTDRKGRRPDGKDADLRGQSGVLLKPAFETSVGVENAALPAADRGYLWFELTEIIPQRLKPLAEVRDDAVKGWRDDEIRSRLVKKGQELIARGAASGDAFAALAKEVNAEVKTTKALKRSDVEPGLPLSAIKQAFALKEKALAAAPATGSKGRAVFRIESVTEPKALDDAAAGAMRKRLESALGGDLVTQYVAGLERSYGVKINERTFQAAIGGELVERTVHDIPDVD